MGRKPLVDLTLMAPEENFGPSNNQFVVHLNAISSTVEQLVGP